MKLHLLAFAAVAVFLPTPAGAAVADSCTVPPVVAHRGGALDSGHTENTIRGYVADGAAGIDQWETDVRFDRHGVPYLMHDSPIGRTTNGSGWASYVDIATTTVRMNDGALLRNQTLERFLAYAARYGATVSIEPKVVPTASQAQRIEDLVDRYGMRARVVVDSFHAANLAPLRRIAPDLSYAYVSGSVVALADARDYDGVFIKDSALTADIVAAYHAAGVKVWSWTVDTQAGWTAHEDIGLDGVVTNAPAQYDAWRAGVCG